MFHPYQRSLGFRCKFSLRPQLLLMKQRAHEAFSFFRTCPAQASLVTNFKEHLRDEIGVPAPGLPKTSKKGNTKLRGHTWATPTPHFFALRAPSKKEVFIEQIFLKILESGNSDFLHKNRVGEPTLFLLAFAGSACPKAPKMLPDAGAADLLQALYRCAQHQAVASISWCCDRQLSA